MGDLLHPNGQCTCGGEGRCRWCIRVEGLGERSLDPAVAQRRLAALEQVAEEAEALLDIIDMGETETGFDEESKELRQAIVALAALDGGTG